MSESFGTMSQNTLSFQGIPKNFKSPQSLRIQLSSSLIYHEEYSLFVEVFTRSFVIDYPASSDVCRREKMLLYLMQKNFSKIDTHNLQREKVPKM